jgi:alpha-D-xyloside xylohydrolase
MKIQLLLCGFLLTSVFNVKSAELPPSYVQTKDGVIVYTDPLFTGTSNAVKLEVLADNIIRVIAASGKEIASTQSLITVYTKRADLLWNVVPAKETVTLKTKNLIARVDRRTGTVSFFDKNGKEILGEFSACSI